MRENNLEIKDYIQKSHLNSKVGKKLHSKYKKVFYQINNETKTPNQFFYLFNKNYKLGAKISELKKFRNFNTVVLIGMGGSILGSEAIYEFLKKDVKKKFYFLNDLDIAKIQKVKKKITIKKTLFIVISKSGNTTETLSNLFYLDILEKKLKNIIVITQKKDSILFNITKKFNLFFIEHKNYIGGRYSVLSDVGLVPAYFMGINMFKLRKNIDKYISNNQILKDSSTKLANILIQKKMPNLVFLNYSKNLAKFLFWAQQLIAESLGKKSQGFFPIVSNVPKDHHSLLQLYLDGPKDKLFIIFSIDEKPTKKLVLNKFLNKKKFFINNKSLNQIKSAQKNALIETLKKNRISFREFKLKKDNVETLGQLFSYFILETILIGKLTNINPFNQPAVEQVKIVTKKYLLK